MEQIPFCRDLQDEAALFRCAICGGEIYAGERYYQTDEGAVCRDCLIWYAKRQFLPLLHTAEPRFREVDTR